MVMSKAVNVIFEAMETICNAVYSI